MKLKRLRLAPLLGALLLAACGADGPPTPVAKSLELDGREDAALQGIFQAENGEPPLTFTVSRQPAHGRIALTQGTAQFEYVPDPDFFGTDSFAYTASGAGKTSAPATVTVRLANVNDPPVLAPLPDLTNSAESRQTFFTADVSDVDGDPVTLAATVADPSVAEVEIDSTTHRLMITPLRRGATAVTVEASDAEFSTTRTLNFTVTDVTKGVRIADDGTGTQVISLANSWDRPIELRLTHNDFPQFRTDAEILDRVRGLTPRYAGEPFERKLWRYIRDSTYHNVPLSVDRFQNDPWIIMSSLGWGFCSQVSSTFVRLAGAAGYEARVRGLTGHVVAEIWIDGAWRVYDPDLAVYYSNYNLQIASVDELGTAPALITDAIDPILDREANPFPYSNIVASIYSSTADNFVSLDFTTVEGQPHELLTLPVGSRFLYPGNWTPAPVGLADGVSRAVPYYLQGMLVLPAGWRGSLPLPWMIADIQGEGRVNLGGVDVDLGTDELAALLKSDQTQWRDLQVVESRSELHVIFFINAIRYRLQASNAVALTGLDVWAVNVTSETLPDMYRVAHTDISALRKPRPTAIP